MQSGAEKQHAHDLIDRLPSSQIGTVVRFLEFMLLDPVARALVTAPPDDEAVTIEDRHRFDEAKVSFQKANGIPMEEVLAEFGLKPQDFPPHTPDNKQ